MPACFYFGSVSLTINKTYAFCQEIVQNFHAKIVTKFTNYHSAKTLYLYAFTPFVTICEIVD